MNKKSFSIPPFYTNKYKQLDRFFKYATLWNDMLRSKPTGLMEVVMYNDWYVLSLNVDNYNDPITTKVTPTRWQVIKRHQLKSELYKLSNMQEL